MVFIWPMILSFYYLLDEKKSIKSTLQSGMWMGIQFLTGTYLGVMGLGMSVLYYVSSFCFDKNRDTLLKRFGVFFVSFFVVAGISIYGYFLVNTLYHPVREQGQYVSYAAHITDYLFPINRSFFYGLLSSWSDLNKHGSSERAAFVGLLPLLVVGGWIFRALFNKRNVNIRLDSRLRGNDKTVMIWLISLIIIGFVFSLGPRFNWNGEYKVFPLPYLVLLKIFPPLSIIRATARWYVLVHISVSIALVFLLSRIESTFPVKKRGEIMFLIFLFAFLEFYSPGVQTIEKGYKRSSDLFLQQQCKSDNGPILEYPFEYRAEDRTVATYLATKTNLLMYSTLHTCPTLSGFSSFEPPLFLKWQADFDTNGLGENQMQILKDNKFKYVRISINSLTQNEKKDKTLYIHTNKLMEIYRDKESIIYIIKY